MRIIGGRLGGRRFTPPPNIPARPTTDLAREALFNILINMMDLEGVRALDLFGGTGGVSYELISRGASEVITVEKDAGMVAFIKRTAAGFGIGEMLQLVRGDALKYLQGASEPFDLIFADPPYALPSLKTLPDLMIAPQMLSTNGLAVLEHDSRHSFEGHPHFLRTKAYGDTIFTFFTPQPKTA